MNAFTRSTALALIASMTLLVSSASVASAAAPHALLLSPPQQPGFILPKFGFRSYTLAGVGEVVTNVQRGSLAWKMGLQTGDIIRSLNHFDLTYHGAWNDALRSAMFNDGGQVHLHIIDRNTGRVATRNISFGGYGAPHVVAYSGTPTSYLVGNGDDCDDEHFGYPSGPVTYKSVAGPQGKNKQSNSGGQISLNDIAKMFKHKD
jgi:PDZ domain